MKKLGLYLILGAVLFGNEATNNDKLTLLKTFTQTDTLKPQYLFATINIQSSSTLRNIGEIKNQDRSAITSTLNQIIQEAKKGEICKGGSYSINPIVSYKEDKRNIIGQDVDFSLECKFNENRDLDAYNSLLKTINAFVTQNPLLILPQPQIISKITKEEINIKKEMIFNDFLSKIDELNNSYSKILNKSCNIKKINSSDGYTPMPIARNFMAKGVATNASIEANSTHTKAPIINDEIVSININVEMTCK